MSRNASTVRRLLVIVAVLSALAILCAGWGWEGPDNGGSDDGSPAAAVG